MIGYLYAAAITIATLSGAFALTAREQQPAERLQLHTLSPMMAMNASPTNSGRGKEILPGIWARKMGDPPDLKKTFDGICAIPGSIGAVMIREDGTIARASGDLCDNNEAYALSNLMKDAAELLTIIRPESSSLTRVTISRQSDIAVVATLHQAHVYGVKLAKR
ncbi:hypothetical protein IW147_006225 [Coemansia sp. RSA 720]|nr:hypothetical protein IW147_006225 [Coemansia sp. RSA 720]